MKLIKQLICWLKTGHSRRLMYNIHHKQVDLDMDKVYKMYHCFDCDYRGKEFFGYCRRNEYD